MRILVPGAFHCGIMQCVGTTKHNIALQVRLLKINVIFSTYFQNRCSPQITQNILVNIRTIFFKSVSCLEPLLLVPNIISQISKICVLYDNKKNKSSSVKTSRIAVRNLKPGQGPDTNEGRGVEDLNTGCIAHFQITWWLETFDVLKCCSLYVQTNTIIRTHS